LLVFFIQQKIKTRDDGQALPNFFPLTTTESFYFYNSLLCPTTNNHNTQPIYIAQNKLLTSPLKNKKGKIPRREDCKSRSTGRQVLWSRRERVWEGVGWFCEVDGRESGRESAGSVESTGEKSGGSQSGGIRLRGSLEIRVFF
jgi:hypothetical protein